MHKFNQNNEIIDGEIKKIFKFEFMIKTSLKGGCFDKSERQKEFLQVGKDVSITKHLIKL